MEMLNFGFLLHPEQECPHTGEILADLLSWFTLIQNMGKKKIDQLEQLLLLVFVGGSTRKSTGAGRQPWHSYSGPSRAAGRARSWRSHVCSTMKPCGSGTGTKIPSTRFHSYEPWGPLIQVTERICSRQILYPDPQLIRNSIAWKKISPFLSRCCILDLK